MKVYTRTGDSGETGLFGGNRVSKTHARVKAYGTIDELCSLLGLAIADCSVTEVKDWTTQVQRYLFTIGSWLASPQACENLAKGKDAFGGERAARTHLDEAVVTSMEQQIDAWEAKLTPMKSFILPGGSRTGAAFHYARTVCRRAERDVIAAIDSGEEIPPMVLIFLNRLSDALFVCARFINWQEGATESPWL